MTAALTAAERRCIPAVSANFCGSRERETSAPLLLDKVLAGRKIEAHEAARCPAEDRRADAARGGGGHFELGGAGSSSCARIDCHPKESAENHLLEPFDANWHVLSHLGR